MLFERFRMLYFLFNFLINLHRVYLHIYIASSVLNNIYNQYKLKYGQGYD